MATNTRLDQSLKQLKKRGVRITPQREIILTYLIGHHNHPSVETIRDGIMISCQISVSQPFTIR